MALALHLGHPHHSGHGYAGATQARPAFIVLAVVSAAAAAIALAAARGGRRSPGVPGRRTRHVQMAEGTPAQDQFDPQQAGPQQVGSELVGQELADIVSRLRRAMRRAARTGDPALGLSVAQLELLSCLAEHPGVRPSQLARMLRLAPSSVATLLHGLQSAGYVVRSDGADDRRTVSLNLSPDGTTAVTRWHRVNEEIIQAALATLPPQDRATLRGAAPALRDLTTSIDALAD